MHAFDALVSSIHSAKTFPLRSRSWTTIYRRDSARPATWNLFPFTFFLAGRSRITVCLCHPQLGGLAAIARFVGHLVECFTLGKRSSNLGQENGFPEPNHSAIIGPHEEFEPFGIPFTERVDRIGFAVYDVQQRLVQLPPAARLHRRQNLIQMGHILRCWISRAEHSMGRFQMDLHRRQRATIVSTDHQGGRQLIADVRRVSQLGHVGFPVDKAQFAPVMNQQGESRFRLLEAIATDFAEWLHQRGQANAIVTQKPPRGLGRSKGLRWYSEGLPRQPPVPVRIADETEP